MEFLADLFKEAVKAALHEYGAGTALLVLGIVALFIIHERLWESRIREKNEEIARIAKERDRLQEVVLKDRLHSGLDDEGNPEEPVEGD